MKRTLSTFVIRSTSRPFGVGQSTASVAGIDGGFCRSYGHQLRMWSALPLNTGRERLVVLGTGWAAGRLVKDIDMDKYDVTVVSPRNHMVFTPLLPSACVGTVEPRSVAVPIISLQKAFSRPSNMLYTATAKAVRPEERAVDCVSESGDITFTVNYEKLVITTGSQGSTFGIPGAQEFTHPLRDVANAESIRNHLLKNWQAANIPGLTAQERARLLHTIVVGGGPSGTEFAGELADFINTDLAKIDIARAKDMRVTLIEAAELLSTFDRSLREYAVKKLMSEGVHLMKGVVKAVRPEQMELADGQVLHFGMCVWSTGVGPTEFTTSLPFAKTSKGRVAVDQFMRVLVKEPQHGEGQNDDQHLSHGPGCPADVVTSTQEQPSAGHASLVPVKNVFALGDCCSPQESPLPALAQVAEQQGKYLARCLNEMARSKTDTCSTPFVYRSLGSMASLGGKAGIMELETAGRGALSIRGFASWFAWRSAYLTRLHTLRNRLSLMIDWTSAILFGRDVSRW